MHIPKPILLTLTVLNLIVLLGQLRPEGAPPFARVVNIVFLIGSLACFGYLGSRRRE